jgi:hypothetical protein
LFLILCTQAFGQTSFWPTSATPGVPQVTNTTSVTLGLKFTSTMAGSVTGVRFYKGSRNTGTHIGALWSTNGTRLATVTFSAESASGWQQANFSSPVSITANTPYIVSYTAPYGAHAHDSVFNWSSLSTAGPLRVYTSAAGVFTYGSGVLFPVSTWNNSNYWVDVVFTPTSTTLPSTPSSTYTISGTVTGAPAAAVTLSGAKAGSTTTDGLGKFSFTGLSNGSYVVAVSKAGYTFTPTTASVNINGSSSPSLAFVGSAVQTPVQHTVTLSWVPSTSTSLKGYNVYRAAVAGGAFTKLTTSPVATTVFVDSTVASGRTYYYVTTAVNTSNLESSYSNQIPAVVPYP